MAGTKWTIEEDERLKRLWPKATKEEIINSFSRTYASLIIRASQLGIKKAYQKHPYVQSNLSVLLEDSFESFYWIGFLMADGTIIGKKRLRLVLSIKDQRHLLKFKSFCGIRNHFKIISNNKPQIGVHAQDSITVPKICEKYSLKQKKTYNPSSFIPNNKNLFLAFLIGFIDGDGCIKKQSKKRKDSIIAIKMHSSWLDYLNKLSNKLSEAVDIKPTCAKINSKGYAIIHWCNAIVLKYLKNKTVELGLPVLQRKWDRIDLNYESRNEKTIKDKEKLIKLVNKGLCNKVVAEKLQVSQAWVSIEKRKIK